MADKRITIGIVDDHTLFRQGVASLLREYDELEIILEGSNGKDMQEKLGRQQVPGVVLMDINMPVLDGYETTRWIKQNHPSTHVLALSMFEDDESIIKMIKMGAGGYVLKESKPSELLIAIKSIYEKGIYLNEFVSGKLIRSFNNRNDVNFSNREHEFMLFCCSELTYKEIADKMCVSPRTVDNYRESLFQKLQLKSRVGLVLYAIKHDFYNSKSA